MKPKPFHIPLDRRRFLKSITAASAGFTVPGYLAEALTASPTLTQGPYYPLADDIPLDKDNDLVQLADSLTAATGVVTYVTGRVLDANGDPVKNALVELWHADHDGEYVYSAGAGRNPSCDENFAGFGQFLTGSTGAFKFRTIKAGLYTGRTRHYHWGVTLPGRTTRTTSQTGWNEVTYANNGSTWATQNSNDNVFRNLSAAQLQSILLDVEAVEGPTTGEVQANWDFVSGHTPVDPTYPDPGGFVAKGELVAGPGSTPRYKLTIQAYPGYCYEVYSNPTLSDLSWGALPFSLTQTGAIDRHKHVATSEGPLELFVEAPAFKGYYKVSFRVPGANTGTP